MASILLVLALLALLAQASVPLLHAQNWARMQNDGGLSYAFCGTLSPVLLAKMKAVAPPGLYAQGAPAQTAQDCKLCLIMGALGAMLGALVVALLVAAHRPAHPPGGSPTDGFALEHALFQARAPPVLSFN